MNNIVLDPQERFEFGKNWLNFLDNLTEERIVEAENAGERFDRAARRNACGKSAQALARIGAAR